MLELGKYKKTRHSGGNSCVEVALLPSGSVGVRNTRSPLAAHIYTADEWQAFVKGVKEGEFDLPM